MPQKSYTIAQQLSRLALAAGALIGENNITRPWEQNGSMTCGEVDAIATLHLAGGDRDGARNWVQCHAHHDERDVDESSDRHAHLLGNNLETYDEAATSAYLIELDDKIL